MATFAPSPASSRAMARPSPFDAPVTIAALPESPSSIVVLLRAHTVPWPLVCEVLAVAFAEPCPFADLTDWALAIERLGSAGEGWGVAWREGDHLRRYRNPVPMRQ